MSEIEINTYSIRDLRYFRVYCRYCGRGHTFWDRVTHTKRCMFTEAFAQEFERTATRPPAQPEEAT